MKSQTWAESQSPANLILNDKIEKQIAIKEIWTKHEKKKLRMESQETNKIYKSSQTKKYQKNGD